MVYLQIPSPYLIEQCGVGVELISGQLLVARERPWWGCLELGSAAAGVVGIVFVRVLFSPLVDSFINALTVLCVVIPIILRVFCTVLTAAFALDVRLWPFAAGQMGKAVSRRRL